MVAMSSLHPWAVENGSKALFAEVAGDKHPGLRPIVANGRDDQWSFMGTGSSVGISEEIIGRKTGSVCRGCDNRRRSPLIQGSVQAETSTFVDCSTSSKSTCVGGLVNALEKENVIAFLIHVIAAPITNPKIKVSPPAEGDVTMPKRDFVTPKAIVGRVLPSPHRLTPPSTLQSGRIIADGELPAVSLSILPWDGQHPAKTTPRVVDSGMLCVPNLNRQSRLSITDQAHYFPDVKSEGRAGSPSMHPSSVSRGKNAVKLAKLGRCMFAEFSKAMFR
ncbi:hypothetical protein EWM64_g6959 [Hericium alpestre]|uniref:Uncharacterized protein n=1 Tax=Hericium alpestre TaxID=135208 RepID=A0A4Y9ZSN5_9AGAM|nr:hypothetical protein EWM64_g6959 [Hericium alpestre]